MIKCNLLKLSFVWNFHNKIVFQFSLIFFVTVNFYFSNKHFGFCWNDFSITKHIRNHIIKCNQYFFVRIIFFNIFINIIHILCVFNKSFSVLLLLLIGFSISTISSFRSIGNKHDVYRVKDCMKRFCEFLRELAMKIMNSFFKK